VLVKEYGKGYYKMVLSEAHRLTETGFWKPSQFPPLNHPDLAFSVQEYTHHGTLPCFADLGDSGLSTLIPRIDWMVRWAQLKQLQCPGCLDIRDISRHESRTPLHFNLLCREIEEATMLKWNEHAMMFLPAAACLGLMKRKRCYCGCWMQGVLV
jgi:hypothetical protein